MIELLRTYQDDRTLGQMTLENGTVFHTMERPWLNNQSQVSCIPEGVYKLALRDSSVVNRTTHGSHPKGWEVTDVPNRTFIMIHIANFPHELMGCIGIGMRHGILDNEMAVLQSATAFELFMLALAGRDEWYLEIKGAQHES